jgi:hypothetical protein
MPHTSHKQRAGANKKRKIRRPVVTPGSNTNGSQSPQPPTMQIVDEFAAAWQEVGNDSDLQPPITTPSLPTNAKESFYVRYKKCTQRFKDALQAMVPSSIFQSDTVSDLMTAAEYVAENDLTVERRLLKDLKFAIRVRQQVAEHTYFGGDDGHGHFITVLLYCWSLLAPKQRRQSTKCASDFESDEHSLLNRFAGLSTEDKTDEEEEDLDDLPLGPVPRPQETGPKRLSLQELMNGTDRADSIVFLMTLDELMQFNAMHFASVKSTLESSETNNCAPDKLLSQLMQASVATNASIQQVALLEQVFIHDYPHLNTVYRLLANLVLVDYVQALTRLVSEKSPIAAQFSEKHAIEFLGDIMQRAFQAVINPEESNPGEVVCEFYQRWQFDEVPASALMRDSGDVLPTDLEMEQMLVFRIVVDVIRLAMTEAPLVERTTELAGGIPKRSHCWLNDSTYIGQNRSITHTIRLLQVFSLWIRSFDGKLFQVFKRRPWIVGQSWSDPVAPVPRIQVEMDALLMADILPALANSCYKGGLAWDLPYSEEAMPVFSQIKTFIKYPEGAVTWSLAFAMHSLLTAVFEVQGSGHLSVLAEASCAAFKHYIHQLEWLADESSTTTTVLPPLWEKRIRVLLNLLKLLVGSPARHTEAQEMLFAWNPLCAGTILSYVAYFGSMIRGSYVIDSAAQLRATLHLYNALIQAGAIKRGQLELLDWIFDTCLGSKAVWEGPLPERGQYETRFWLVHGVKAELARKFQDVLLSSKKNIELDRNKTPFSFDRLSRSFRRICLRDYSITVSAHSDARPRRAGIKFVTISEFAACVDATLDAMKDDERLLSTNVATLSYYLNDFYMGLFKRFRVMPIAKELLEGTRALHPFLALQFADRILRPLDNGDDDVAAICAQFMIEFFTSIPQDKLTWLNPPR